MEHLHADFMDTNGFLFVFNFGVLSGSKSYHICHFFQPWISLSV